VPTYVCHHRKQHETWTEILYHRTSKTSIARDCQASGRQGDADTATNTLLPEAGPEVADVEIDRQPHDQNKLAEVLTFCRLFKDARAGGQGCQIFWYNIPKRKICILNYHKQYQIARKYTK
jgi:hypothetical protein